MAIPNITITSPVFNQIFEINFGAMATKFGLPYAAILIKKGAWAHKELCVTNDGQAFQLKIGDRVMCFTSADNAKTADYAMLVDSINGVTINTFTDLTTALKNLVLELPESLCYYNEELTNSLIEVKSSAGLVTGFNFINLGGASAYVKLFDAVNGAPTLGTTQPVATFMIPANGSLWRFLEKDTILPLFTTAIYIAVTDAPGLADVSAPSAPIFTQLYYL